MTLRIARCDDKGVWQLFGDVKRPLTSILKKINNESKTPSNIERNSWLEICCIHHLKEAYLSNNISSKWSYASLKVYMLGSYLQMDVQNYLLLKLHNSFFLDYAISIQKFYHARFGSVSVFRLLCFLIFRKH